MTSDEGHKPLDSEINVNITYIPESEYAQAVADAETSKTLPDIFRSDLLDVDIKMRSHANKSIGLNRKS